MFTSGRLSAAFLITNSGTTDATTLPGHTRTDDRNGRSVPANVTTVLTVTNVTISDNGADYICAQGFFIKSDTVYLNVLGKVHTYVRIHACVEVKFYGHIFMGVS